MIPTLRNCILGIVDSNVLHGLLDSLVYQVVYVVYMEGEQTWLTSNLRYYTFGYWTLQLDWLWL